MGAGWPERFETKLIRDRWAVYPYPGERLCVSSNRMTDWGLARLRRKRLLGGEERETPLRGGDHFQYSVEVKEWEADQGEYDVILASLLENAER